MVRFAGAWREGRSSKGGRPLAFDDDFPKEVGVEDFDDCSDYGAPGWIPGFLAALRECGQVKAAAASVGRSPPTIYDRRRSDARFAAAYEACRQAAAARTAPDVPPANAMRTHALGRRKLFLEALAETSNVTASAKRANWPLRSVYKLRREEASFADEWRAALIEGYDMLEMEMLCYLRDPAPTRKMDVAAALRLLAAHRETVARQRALAEDDDEQAVLDSIDRFIDDMRERRAANAALLLEDRREAETGAEIPEEGGDAAG